VLLPEVNQEFEFRFELAGDCDLFDRFRMRWLRSSENMRELTLVVIDEVKRGDWGVGSRQGRSILLGTFFGG
jgi:hypothetical protein